MSDQLMLIIFGVAWVGIGAWWLIASSRVSRFTHNVLGWHSPIQSWKFDGLSMTSICRTCGKHILQDLHGQWFSIKRKKV